VVRTGEAGEGVRLVLQCEDGPSCMKETQTMAIFRKAHSVVGALLMLQILAQFYFIAAALFTITGASDNAKAVYAAFKNADSFAGIHALNGDLVGITILVLTAIALGSRYP